MHEKLEQRPARRSAPVSSARQGAGFRWSILPRHNAPDTLPKPSYPLPPAAAGFGFVTIATRSRAYAEMAVDMVLSLREFHEDPVCLIADDFCADIVESHYPGAFDHVVRITGPDLIGYTSKFMVAEYTPYDRALFIDADTIVIGSLTIYKRQAAVDAMFMMGNFKSAKEWAFHNQLPIRPVGRAFGLTHFYANHSGFFGFQRHAARGLLAEARRVYLEELHRWPWLWLGTVGDEVCYGIVGGRYGMADMAKPYPVLWNNELKAMKRGLVDKPLVHFHAAPSPEGLDWLMDGVVKRREAAGFPAVSVDIWRAKATRSDARVWFRLWYRRAKATCRDGVNRSFGPKAKRGPTDHQA